MNYSRRGFAQQIESYFQFISDTSLQSKRMKIVEVSKRSNSGKFDNLFS